VRCDPHRANASRCGPRPVLPYRDLLAETRNSCREFAQRGVYVAMVVPESARSQVVEHWLQRGPIFRADAVEPDGVADVDIAKMAKVLSDRPGLPTLCPARLRRDSRDHLTDRAGQACDDADGVVDVLDRLALNHGAPHYVRFDNGPEFVAHAVSDWCRFHSAGSLFIDPGSPWQNAWIESFNGRLRDELLNSWRFDSLLEARVIIEDWRCDYNANRPHSAHGELTPAEFALQWTTTHQPQAA